jgi:ketosteroid isomerase-like protein
MREHFTSQEQIMFYFSRWLAAFAVLACFSGLVRAGDESDIKATAKSFAEALSKGDADAAKQQMVRTDDTDSMIDAITPVIAGRLKLDKALVDKFGKDAVKGVSGGIGMNQAMTQYADHVEDADVKIDGDTATVSRKPDADKKPAPGGQSRDSSLHMKKVDGNWKVDLTSVQDIQKTKERIPMMQAMGKVFTELADEVDGGKYKTVAEVNGAMRQKMVATFGGGGRQGGRPGATPVK